MRLCVPIPCFYGKEPFETAVKTVAGIGYDAVEIYDWRGLDFDRARGVCEENSVELVSMCTTEFRMTAPEHRAAWLKGLAESCQAANRLGVKKLITQVGPDTGESREFQHRSILNALKTARPILEGSGVTLMLEPLNTLVNHKGYYLVSSAEGFDLVREAESEHIKLVFDIYHQQISEGNILPNILANLDCIAHLHAAGHPGRHELQRGESNYPFIFNTVDRAGYTGCCGLEYFPTMDPTESLIVSRQLFGGK